MSRRTRTTAILLSGAALLGGGTATSAQAHHGHGDQRGMHAKHWRGHHHGLGRAARELGVTKDQLKAAIEAARRQQASQPKPTTREEFKARKDAFIAAVAQQLNKPADQVADALAGGKRGGCGHGGDDDGGPGPAN
jgi:Spy/CpxP family protein refolding chaperone